MKGEGGNKAKGCVYITLTEFFASSRDDDTISTYTIHQYDMYYICVVTPIRSREKKERLAKGELLKCLVLRSRRDKIQLVFAVLLIMGLYLRLITVSSSFLVGLVLDRRNDDFSEYNRENEFPSLFSSLHFWGRGSLVRESIISRLRRTLAWDFL